MLKGQKRKFSYESATVVVQLSLSIPKSLQDWVDLNNLLLNGVLSNDAASPLGFGQESGEEMKKKKNNQVSIKRHLKPTREHIK